MIISNSDLLTWVDPPPLQAIGRDAAPPYISPLLLSTPLLLLNVAFPVYPPLEWFWKKDIYLFFV